MGDWLALNGLVPPSLLPLFALIAILLAAVWLALRREGAIAFGGLSALTCAATAALVLLGDARCGAGGCSYLDTTSPY